MSFQHGGQLEKIKQAYPEQRQPWIDLSTGISPFAYPLDCNDSPDVNDQSKAQSLPQYHEQLKSAAANYYATEQLLITPGSMWGIQNVPLMRRVLFPNDTRPVLLPKQGFNEHKKAWMAWGFEIESYESEPSLDQLKSVQVCVVINPNNPTGVLFDKAQLMVMHKYLVDQQACLLVDEAFLDLSPELSMSTEVNKQGLIVLKSFGKYFGLPGLRIGALIAQPEILTMASNLLNPWSISSMAQHIAIQAFLDTPWQCSNKLKLKHAGNRLKALLSDIGYAVQGTEFFQTHYTSQAKLLHDVLLSKGIYTRLLDDESGVRFGLPRAEHEWLRLEFALQEFKQCNKTELQSINLSLTKAEPA